MKLIIIFVGAFIALAVGKTPYETMTALNIQNIKILYNAWKKSLDAVCAADIDLPVNEAFGTGEIQNIKIYQRSPCNHTRVLKLKDMEKVTQDLKYWTPGKKTILYVVGWPSIQNNVVEKVLQTSTCQNEYDVVVLDVTNDLPALYNTITSKNKYIAYLLFRLIQEMFNSPAKIEVDALEIVGISTGAQIAMQAAQIFKTECESHKLKRIIALDPAYLCNKVNYLKSGIVKQLVVWKSDNSGAYGINRKLDADVTLNLNGDCVPQPGCSSNQCSHLLATLAFIETVCKPKSLLASEAKCWESFSKGDYGRQLWFNLRMPLDACGNYYARTSNNSKRLTLGKEGASPLKRSRKD